MKKIFQPLILLFAFFYSGTSWAQTKLLIQFKGDVPYVTYMVQPGETLSGIGKQFGSDIGTVMRFNGMNANSKLVVGETVKVPVKMQMLQQGNSAQQLNTALVHVVGKKETLYRISLNHNKVPVDQLKLWNGLTDNAISEGQQLIVGFLNTSAIATPSAPTEVTTPSTQPTVDPVAKTVIKESPSGSNDFEIAKPSSATIVPVAATEQQNNSAELSESRAKVKEKELAIDPKKVKESGFFTTLYGVDVDDRSAETVAGTAMTFKSSSGWADKKYYILMNGASPGAIVKVSTGGAKHIYAKVLWGLGSLKENDGLDFRLSNAAAAALGISEARFPLQVTYFD